METNVRLTTASPRSDTLYVSEIGANADLPSENDAEIRVIFR